jgi:phage replication-related protein YjqB (UPF0714/DUF867 family)
MLMSPDQYLSFEQLFADEQAGVDYKIVNTTRASKIVILAPHGGLIEPGTSEIATVIAGDDYSLYLFEGLRRRPHCDLHITSHRYDEPQAVAIVNDSEIVVAIHGRGDDGDSETVWTGGLDAVTGGKLVRELNLAGFPAKIENAEHGATHPKNICNRGRTSAGVQLEIPRSLRDRLRAQPETLRVFSQAFRKALPAA